MTTKSNHGTIAAARRHERRGEELCEACQQARREHNAEQYRRRRRAEADKPAVVAVLPAGVLTIPVPWTQWDGDGPLTAPGWTYQSTPGARLARRTINVEWTPNLKGLDPIATTVTAWKADDPRAGDMLATLPPQLQAAVYHKLGYNALGHGSVVGVGPMLPRPWDHVRGADEPAPTIPEPEWPWPLKAHVKERDLYVRGDAFPHEGDLVVSTSEGRIVRAPAGTPIPEGWTAWDPATAPNTNNTLLLARAPFRVVDSNAAVDALVATRNTDMTTIVVADRPGGVEVWRGVGAFAKSLGVFANVDDGVAAARVSIDEDAIDLAWTGVVAAPTVVRASSPSWDAVNAAGGDG